MNRALAARAILIAGTELLILTGPARAQQPAARPVPNDNPPDWVYADTNLVDHAAWISGTVVKNVVILAFKPGTTFERQAAIVRMVRGTIVQHDSTLGADGFLMIRVASHPDACAVKQAVELLEHVAEVEMATPEVLLPFTEDGRTPPRHSRITHKGYTAACPAGTGLLR